MVNGGDSFDPNAEAGAVAETEPEASVGGLTPPKPEGILSGKELAKLFARHEQQAFLPAAKVVREAGQPIARSVPYHSLMRTGRAVSLRREHRKDPGGYWLDVQFAGPQNEDGSSRVFSINFAHRKAATNTANQLVAQIRRLIAAGKIHDDETYNALLEAFRLDAKEQILERGK